MFESNSMPFNQLYDVYEVIGSGQFATVRRCIHKDTGNEFAGKFIRKRRSAGRINRLGVPMDDIQREINILQEINHENIIKLYDVFDNGNEIILLLELVKGGELFEYFTGKDNLSEEEACSFIKQILLGLEYMHKRSIVHLDLKPENVMLCNDNSRQIKLIDFGLSRKINSESDTKGLYGTPEFVAPEVISYEPISTATDMWSLGCLTYLLLSGASPFLGETKQETFSNITALDYQFDEEYFSNISDLAKEFISHLLVKDPRKRSTVTQCLTHSWIRPKNNYDESLRRNSEINVIKIKSYIARQRWRHALHSVFLCNRMSKSIKHINVYHGLSQNGGSTMSSLNVVQQEERDFVEHDENFVSAAIFAAIEEGNLNGIQELFSMSNINANQCNKHGESLLHYSAGMGHFEILKFLHSKGANICAVDDRGDSIIHWSSRQNHPIIIRYLYDNGANVDQLNKNLETPLHVAARYGHSESVEQLCKCGANVDAIDEHGETALIISVWHGFPKIVHILGEVGAKTDLRNKDGESALHVACARGHTDCVRCLLETGIDLNPFDKNHHTPFHLALKRQHVAVAMLLLRAGCDIEMADGNGDRPIHYAARSNHHQICQTLCAFGCNVNVPNKNGLTPLHLAAKNGHIEIVRSLCLAGCKIDQKNRDGIIPEISATAQNHNDIADLLNRLRNEQLKDEYISQLIPTTQTIQRVKLKIFGHSGTGKSMLIDSLKCGYFSSWFRRSSKSTSSKKVNEEPVSEPTTPTPTNMTGSVNFQWTQDNYTKGVDCQQVTISGVGDLSIWEFSGHEPYYQIYDHFIGNSNCIHAIVFRLCDHYDVQLQMVKFWLYFLQSRMPVFEPLAYCGKSSKAAKVILIATHADVPSNVINNINNNDVINCDVQSIMRAVKSDFANIFDIHDQIITMDANAVGSPAMKQLKQYLNQTKPVVLNNVPPSTMFLDAVMAFLNICRKAVSTFPVLSWQQFKEMIRTQVNPLATEEHMKELVQQLQVMGEILYLPGKADNSQDLVVINPRWFTVDIIGYLLSHEYINKNRVSGIYSVDDLQLIFPETDALDLLQVLEAVSICCQCDHEGDIEYEYPCFNMLEYSDSLWERNDVRYSNSVYCGICIQCEVNIANNLSLLCVFPRFQIALRQYIQKYANLESSDLYQWSKGSKLCIGPLEAILLQTTLDSSLSYQAIYLKIRGPFEMRSDCFFFMENIINVIESTLYEICPGLSLKKSYLTPQQLREHKEYPSLYSNNTLLKSLLKNDSNSILKEKVKSDDLLVEETVADIICCGIDNFNSLSQTNKYRSIIPFQSFIDHGSLSSASIHHSNVGPMLAPNLHSSNISLLTKQKLCAILDPPEPIGRDWCMLGVLLGMTDKLPKLDPGNNAQLSPASRVFDECLRDANCTISALVKKLEELARHDAIDVILQTAPLLRIFPTSSQPEEGIPNNDESGVTSSGVSSGSHTSSSNLSR